MERAIKDLCQLSDADLFKELATGIGHVVAGAVELDAAARKLSKAGNHYPARVLRNLAEEEAAKVLILVDAARCPRARKPEMARTLGYFYSHLAKGIYAEVVNWRPIDFAEVCRGIENHLVEHYLDGPNDVDWIFPNAITRQREDDLYVGYVRDDGPDDNGGARYWAVPRSDDPIDSIMGYRTPAAVALTHALHLAQATTSEGLGIIAEIWREAHLRPEMRYDDRAKLSLRTLENLNHKGLLSPALNDVWSEIGNHWPFPLWPLDLAVRKVKKQALRETRRHLNDYF